MLDRSPEAANDHSTDRVLDWVERWTSPIEFLAILVALVFLLWAASASAETLSGRVVSVADGDTVTVLDGSQVQHTIRVMGIDAPEKKQAFGNRAKQRMSYLVYDKAVLIDYKKRDRYGRIVGKVMVAPGDACPSASPDCPKTLDAGLALITVGLAWLEVQ